MSDFAKWWFIAGGSVHGAFKYRQWSALKELATKLPKMAWDAREPELSDLRAQLSTQSQEIARLKERVGKLRESLFLIAGPVEWYCEIGERNKQAAAISALAEDDRAKGKTR